MLFIDLFGVIVPFSYDVFDLITMVIAATGILRLLSMLRVSSLVFTVLVIVLASLMVVVPFKTDSNMLPLQYGFSPTFLMCLWGGVAGAALWGIAGAPGLRLRN